MRVFSLSHHAAYACRHSGACCTAGWAIPVEPDRRPLLGTNLLPQDTSGACRFFDRSSRLCVVQRDHGEAMMPSSCQHFPRRALIDDRGLFVTLSHYCPTAAAMLFEATVPMTIVESPAAFPAGRDWDGLDARGQWPPLLRPGVIFDLESYTTFEGWAIEVLARETTTASALGTLANVAERVRGWDPGYGSLGAWTGKAIAQPDGAAAESWRPYASLQRLDAYDDVVRAVPDEHQAERLSDAARRGWHEFAMPVWNDFAPVLGRYLGAKLFGSWMAYQGYGVRTQLAELAVSETVVRAEAGRLCANAERALDRALLTEAIRAADWLLVHLVDRPALVHWLGGIEAADA